MVVDGAGRRRGPVRAVAALVAVGLAGSACSGESAAEPASAASTVAEPPSAAPEPAANGDASAAPVLPERLAAATDAFEPRECPEHLDGVRAGPSETCGFVTVPLDHADPSGPTIRLAVTFLDNGSPDVPPTIILPGGPRVSAARTAADLKGAPFDVIGIDERGAGSSEPSLDCPEIGAGFPEDLLQRPADGWDAYLDAVSTCRDRLVGEGIDLEKFDTAQSARDLGVVQRALGFDEVMLLGISYGARTALTRLRDQPEGVASAWLDSIVPLEADMMATLGANFERGFDRIAAECAASESCAELGDVHELMASVEARLAAEPVTISGQRPFGAGEVDVLVDDEVLRSVVLAAMYSGSTLKRVPLALAAADAGDFGPLEPLVDGWMWAADPALPYAEGAGFSSLCREEYPFNDAEAVADNAAFSSYDWAAVCDAWGVEPADAQEDESVSSDVPIMVFAGSFDPVTPPEWSRSVAEALPNSTYVEFADQGHGVGPATRCARDMIEAFVSDPTAELDTSCVADSGAPSWLVN